MEHRLDELTRKRFLTVRTVWHWRSMVRFIRHHGLRGLSLRTIGLEDNIRRTEETEGAPAVV